LALTVYGIEDGESGHRTRGREVSEKFPTNKREIEEFSPACTDSQLVAAAHDL
jgi:hypothetical protein